jgi:hypothetical protein
LISCDGCDGEDGGCDGCDGGCDGECDGCEGVKFCVDVGFCESMDFCADVNGKNVSALCADFRFSGRSRVSSKKHKSMKGKNVDKKFNRTLFDHYTNEKFHYTQTHNLTTSSPTLPPPMAHQNQHQGYQTRPAQQGYQPSYQVYYQDQQGRSNYQNYPPSYQTQPYHDQLLTFQDSDVENRVGDQVEDRVEEGPALFVFVPPQLKFEPVEEKAPFLTEQFSQLGENPRMIPFGTKYSFG